MSLSKSRHAYLDCQEVFDRALEDPKGVRVRMKDMDSAMVFRTRAHYFRKLLRDESRQVYEEGEPQYGVSPYDRLVLRLRRVENKIYIYIEQTYIPEEIESLSFIEPEITDGGGDHQGSLPEPVEEGSIDGVRDLSEDERQSGLDQLAVRSSKGLRRV